MIIEATFVTSAATANGLPRDGLAEIAMVGRSNVGKSSLINALVRQRVARGGAAPFYLVDLPGYGYARGGGDAAREFEALSAAYFGRDRRDGQERRALPASQSALLLVDARHPALESDLAAWAWLTDTGVTPAIVATKIDKLSRAERLRALKANEAAFEHPVLPVSASTGEGLDELWKLIERLTSRNPNNRRPPRPPRRLPRS